MFNDTARTGCVARTDCRHQDPAGKERPLPLLLIVANRSQANIALPFNYSLSGGNTVWVGLSTGTGQGGVWAAYSFPGGTALAVKADLGGDTNIYAFYISNSIMFAGANGKAYSSSGNGNWAASDNGPFGDRVRSLSSNA